MNEHDALVATLRDVEQLIETIKAEATERGISPYLMKDPNGVFVMAAPLTALLNARSALVHSEHP